MKLKIIKFFGLFFALFCIKWKRKITENEIKDIKQFPNHIILTKTKWCLTNIFIRGKYKHAGIITEDCKYVVEATTHGVRKTELKTFLQNKNKYLIIRPQNYSEEEKKIVEFLMYDYIGRPYDWLFFWEETSLYCSELVALVFNRVRQGLFSTKGIIEPSELLNDKISKVWIKEI